MKKGSVTITYRQVEQINTLHFTYDALVNKLQKKVIAAGTTTTTDYANGLLYKNGQLQFVSHSEGYLEPKANGTLEYVYQYTDHLGNIRLSYKKGSSDELIVVEEDNYYPFGLRHEGYNNIVDGEENPYRYNGKELNEELGLGWYDYGARNYMPDLGRYFNLDRFSEAFVDLSPFQYAGNNPIKFVDVNGDYIYIRDGDLYRYENGGIQNREDGKWRDYQAKEGSYLSEIVGFLNKIVDGDKYSFGSRFLKKFENNDINVTISRNNSEDKDKKNKNYTIGINIFTSFNQKGTMKTTRGEEGINENYHITLFHELAHGYANNVFDYSILSQPWIDADPSIGVNKPIKKSEVYASTVENFLRAEQELELRTHYLGGPGSNRSRLIQRSKRKSPFYEQYKPTIETRQILMEILKSRKR